ncbi:class D sortase [Paludibaculum fermentans]|uniref:Class D sortase n=1 Tax=Paludibaculum fermentans TaxID=1473598 RepID=A0A7S7NMT6_PALFE|nr:class D sortase [Paludibaculum fermentans]QOY86430.1 class D sortase [Paludibaculum fermentans]
MRIIAPRHALRLALKWCQYLLFAGGAAMLGYSGLALADALYFQHQGQRQLQQALASRPTDLADASPAAPTATNASLPPASIPGLIGRIEISRLDLDVIVAEGIDGKTLRRAAGHIPGTALPGELGNIGISAHRDTFFRPLRDVRRNDLIKITTPGGEFRYRVVSTRVVEPRDVTVLDSGEGESLTLVTCYPFSFVGPAPDRFIVRAERVL